MRSQCFYLVLLLLSSVIFTLGSPNDSLQYLITTTESDSLRSLICRRLASRHMGDSSVLWTQKTLVYAQKSEVRTLVFESYRFLGNIYAQQKKYDRATAQFLSALRYKEVKRLEVSAYTISIVV